MANMPDTNTVVVKFVKSSNCLEHLPNYYCAASPGDQIDIPLALAARLTSYGVAFVIEPTPQTIAACAADLAECDREAAANRSSGAAHGHSLSSDFMRGPDHLEQVRALTYGMRGGKA
jgi:hypothetical protein